MSTIEQAIFTNMCMIYDDAGNILIQDRKSKTWGGVTFPGGHVEKGESFVVSVKREVLEETGLHIFNPELCGIKQFQTKEEARYIVLLYKTNQYRGTLTSSEEGEVFWIPRKDLHTYDLAPDFEQMVEVMESNELTEFFYKKNKVHLY